MTTKYLVFFRYDRPVLYEAMVEETPKTYRVLESKPLIGTIYGLNRRYYKDTTIAFDTYLEAVMYLAEKVDAAIERHRASIASLGNTAADLHVIINSAKRSMADDHHTTPA